MSEVDGDTMQNGKPQAVRAGGPWRSNKASCLQGQPTMSAAVSSIVFDDIFMISDIDLKEGNLTEVRYFQNRLTRDSDTDQCTFTCA